MCHPALGPPRPPPRQAKEAIGAIAKLSRPDGTSLTINVEYNQLDPLLRATINQEGDVNEPSTGGGRGVGVEGGWGRGSGARWGAEECWGRRGAQPGNRCSAVPP